MAVFGFEIIFVLAILAALYTAWGIGANDVANAMGTSVGSGAITFKQAILIAAVFEFAGAVLVGSDVTNTVRKSIVDPLAYEATPDLFIYGMVAALLAAGLWLTLASYLSLPVSTTHSIVGSIIGFGLASKGLGVVDWFTTGKIVASWVTSPLLGGIAAFVTFSLIRRFILDKKDPIRATVRYAPLLFYSAAVIIGMATLFKGLSNLSLDFGFVDAFLISSAIAIPFALLGTWYLRRKDHEQFEDRQERYQFVEGLFGVLQVVTAASVAFAHGANDVANSIGPLAAVVGVMNAGGIVTETAVPLWILALGGLGIVVGLATYGWKVIVTIGGRITELTPSRGYSAEIAAALTILTFSRLGVPISTTHTLVGSVIGVGFARGIPALDLRMVGKIFLSWILTLPIAGATAAGIYYGLVYLGI